MCLMSHHCSATELMMLTADHFAAGLGLGVGLQDSGLGLGLGL